MKISLKFPLYSLLLGILATGVYPLNAAPTFEVVGRFSTANSGPQAGVVFGTDLSLNLYGTTRSGGNLNKGTIYKVGPTGTFSTILTFTGSNGQGPLSGLVLNQDGNFYGSMTGTSGLGTLFRITQTGTLTKLAQLTAIDGNITDHQPQGNMLSANDGNLYGVTSAGGPDDLGTIFKLTTSGSFSYLHLFEDDDGSVPLAAPIQAKDGNLYGTTSQGGDEGVGTVYKISLSGGLTTLFSFTGDFGQSPNSGLIQGKDGFFYGTSSSADNTQGAVYKVSSAGVMSVLFEFTTNLGMVPVGGVVQGNDGNFYGVTPQGGASGFGVVYKVTPTGHMSIVYSFKGVTSGVVADGGNPASPLTLASDGNIYGVTSSTLYRIRFGPKPVSYSASSVSYSSATLNGHVNPYGDSTTVFFEYALEDPTLTGATAIEASPKLSGTAPQIASADVKGLFSSSTYFYRVKAVNAFGTQYGVVKSFTTKPFLEPTTAIDIHAEGVTLKTTINPNGEAVRVYFQYGIDFSLSGTDTALAGGMTVGHGFNDVSVVKTLGDLLPQTTYYYRAETVGLVTGTQTGNTHSFTTRVMGQFNGMVTNAAPTGIYSGFISVKLNSNQSMTGVLYFGGVRYSLSGVFGSNGNFIQTIKRGDVLPSIVVRLIPDPVNHRLTGTVVEGTVTSQIVAGQSLYDSTSAAAPQAGKYTLQLPPDPANSGTAFVQGSGYLSLSVSTAGQVSVAGKLGDGSAISAHGVLVSGSVFPLYAGLYGSNSSTYKGSIFGNIVFDTPANPTCEGTLVWYKAEQLKNKSYPQGFSATIDAIGSTFTVLGSGTNAFTGSDQPNDAQISFGQAGIDDISESITLLPNNKSIVESPSADDRITLSIAPKTGIFSGGFVDPVTRKKYGFKGIILQNQAIGAGYFLGGNQSGSVDLE